ncbi:hypothetical protein CK203_116339 [Vitis vinifera]|uniref:Reverse transcriptase Ty1/copia-type domain-containing protein n=1 Tax=Vitis vinifera TaxID=29760 RepID=A0A438CAA2_VITVI|nr:hypothetical protein CK203_116339 [Vitis vinifera]
MVVEESIHVIFYESNNSLQERESFDDDLGLETSMGKLQIEDRRQQEEIVEDPKKEESPLALPPPQQVQGESSQDLPKDWKFVINHPQDQIIEFSKCMHSEFEMSMMGELNFFLGLQIKQLKEGTFINQAKYIRDLLKRFNMEEAKTMKTPMSSSIKLDKDEKGQGRITRQENAKKIGLLTIDQASTVRTGRPVLLLSDRAPQAWIRPHLRVFRASSWTSSSCVWFQPHLHTFSPFFILWMAPRRETGTSKAQGKRPAEPSQPEQMEARQKARYDTPSSIPLKIISDTNKNSLRGKLSQGEVSISPNFSTSGLRDSLIGWDGCQL